MTTYGLGAGRTPLPGDLARPVVTVDSQSTPIGIDAEQQRANQETEAASGIYRDCRRVFGYSYAADVSWGGGEVHWDDTTFRILKVGRLA